MEKSMISVSSRVLGLWAVAGFTLSLPVQAAPSQERNLLLQLQQSIAGASDARGSAVPIFLRPGVAFDSWGESLGNGLDLSNLADSGTACTFFIRGTDHKFSELYKKILEDAEPISSDSANDAQRLAAA